jgi:hypothetical protein
VEHELTDPNRFSGHCKAQATTHAADRLDISGNTELMGNLHKMVLGDIVLFGDLGNRREIAISKRKIHQEAQ